MINWEKNCLLSVEYLSAMRHLFVLLVICLRPQKRVFPIIHFLCYINHSKSARSILRGLWLWPPELFIRSRKKPGKKLSNNSLGSLSIFLPIRWPGSSFCPRIYVCIHLNLAYSEWDRCSFIRGNYSLQIRNRKKPDNIKYSGKSAKFDY